MSPSFSSLTKRRLAGLTAILLLAWPVAAQAQKLPLLPDAAQPAAPQMELTGRVIDHARLLSTATRASLTSELEALEQEIGPQFVVVSVTSLLGQDIAEFGRQLGNGWGLGDPERNDGLLLIVAPVERQVRIEVGLGLEPVLTDDFCAGVIAQQILPAFVKGEMEQGILQGAHALMARLRSAHVQPLAESRPS